MPQNTPNYNSNIHFGPPSYPGGASRAQNLKIAVPGGYLKDQIWVLWNFCPIFGHLTLFGWSKLKILTLVVYPTPLLSNISIQNFAIELCFALFRGKQIPAVET